MVWATVWISEGAIFLYYRDRLDEFAPFRLVLIVNNIAFSAKFLNLLIVGFVIYKSSRVLVSLSNSDEIEAQQESDML